MSRKNKKSIDLWVVLHTPEELKARGKEVALSIHSQLIIDESRPTKLSGSHMIHLQGSEDIFLVRLDIDEGTPLFIHAVAIVEAAPHSVSNVENHYIGYKNIRIETGFKGNELLVDICDFQIYRLCRPVLAFGASI